MNDNIVNALGIGFTAGFITGIIMSAVARLRERVEKVESKNG